MRPQVRQLDLTPPVSYALHAHLIPSFYLERMAQTRPVSAGESLRELAERLRSPLFESGGALAELSEGQQSQLNQQAKELAEVFQRSSSNVCVFHAKPATDSTRKLPPIPREAWH